MLDTDKKLGEYETTAVDVANGMHNDKVRAENSKEVISVFPNVRLASEKNKKEIKERRGTKFLSSLLISAVVGTGCFALGNHTRNHRENVERVNYSIEELITRDLASNSGFSFSGDLDFFAEMYTLRLFAVKPHSYMTEVVKQHFQKYVDPKSSNIIVYQREGIGK